MKIRIKCSACFDTIVVEVEEQLSSRDLRELSQRTCDLCQAWERVRSRLSYSSELHDRTHSSSQALVSAVTAYVAATEEAEKNKLDPADFGL